ncbi:MAG: Nif11-like leader peptide family natural product precursor [Thermostichus sp. DG02_5_bins_236]
MSTQAAAEFLDRVGEDASLLEELAKALEAEDDRGAAAQLAVSKGYEVTPDELWEEVQKRQADFSRRQDAGELSDEELEAVAGGEAVLATVLISLASSVTAATASVYTPRVPTPKW